MRERESHYSIGVIDVRIRTECRAYAEQYHSLYAPYVSAPSGSDPIDVEIRPRRRYPWPRGPFTFHSRHAPEVVVEHRHEVLPMLEWYINWQIIAARHEYIQLHASSLERDGCAIILPGDPGSGKTTLTAGLLTRGWSYLCDEFALIDPWTGRVHPYPRALCVKEPAFPVIHRLGLPLTGRQAYRKATKGRVAFLNPLDVDPGIVGRPSPIRWVVFPKYIQGTTATLRPMSRSEAAYLLARQCFNIRTDQRRALAGLAAVARGANCYQLTAGDIDDTCELVETLVAPAATRKVG